MRQGRLLAVLQHTLNTELRATKSTFARNLLPWQQQQGHLTTPPTNQLPHSWFRYCCSRLAPIWGKTQEQKLRPLTTSEPGRLSAIAASVHPTLTYSLKTSSETNKTVTETTPGAGNMASQARLEARPSLRTAQRRHRLVCVVQGVPASSFAVAKLKLPTLAQRGIGQASGRCREQAWSHTDL